MTEDTGSQENATLGLSVELTVSELAVNEAISNTTGQTMGVLNTVLGNVNKVIAANLKDSEKLGEVAVSNLENLQARIEKVLVWSNSDISAVDQLGHVKRELTDMLTSLPKTTISQMSRSEASQYSNYKPVLEMLNGLQKLVPIVSTALVAVDQNKNYTEKSLQTLISSMGTIIQEFNTILANPARKLAAKHEQQKVLKVQLEGPPLSQLDAVALKELGSELKTLRETIKANKGATHSGYPGLDGQTLLKALASDIRLIASQLPKTSAREIREANRPVPVVQEETVSITTGNSRKTSQRRSYIPDNSPLAEVAPNEPRKNIIRKSKPLITADWKDGDDALYTWAEAMDMYKAGKLGSKEQFEAHFKHRVPLSMDPGQVAIDVETPYTKVHKQANKPDITDNGPVYSIGIVKGNERRLDIHKDSTLEFSPWQMRNSVGPTLYALEHAEEMQRKFGITVGVFTSEVDFITSIAGHLASATKVLGYGMSDIYELMKSARNLADPAVLETFRTVRLKTYSDVLDLAKNPMSQLFPGGDTVTWGSAKGSTRSILNTRGMMSLEMLTALLDAKFGASKVGLHSGLGDAELTVLLHQLFSQENAAYAITTSGRLPKYQKKVSASVTKLDEVNPEAGRSYTLEANDVFAALSNVKDRITEVTHIDPRANSLLQPRVEKVLNELLAGVQQFRSKTKGSSDFGPKDIKGILANTGFLDLITTTLGTKYDPTKILRDFSRDLLDDITGALILEKGPSGKDRTAVIKSAIQASLMGVIDKYADIAVVNAIPDLTPVEKLQLSLDAGLTHLNTTGPEIAEIPSKLLPRIEENATLEAEVLASSRKITDLAEGKVVHMSTILREVIAMRQGTVVDDSINGMAAEAGNATEDFSNKQLGKVPHFQILANKEAGAGNSGTGGNISIVLYDARTNTPFARTTPDALLLDKLTGLLSILELKSSRKEALENESYRLQTLLAADLAGLHATIVTFAENKQFHGAVLQPGVDELKRLYQDISKVLHAHGVDIPAGYIKGQIDPRSLEGLVSQMVGAGLPTNFLIEAQRKAAETQLSNVVAANTASLPIGPVIPVTSTAVKGNLLNVAASQMSENAFAKNGTGFVGPHLANILLNAADPTKPAPKNAETQTALTYLQRLSTEKGIDFNKALQAAFGLVFKEIGFDKLVATTRAEFLPKLQKAMNETFSGSSEVLELGQQAFLEAPGTQYALGKRKDREEADARQKAIAVNLTTQAAVIEASAAKAKAKLTGTEIPITSSMPVVVSAGGNGDFNSGGPGKPGGPAEPFKTSDDDYSKNYKRRVGSIDINEELGGRTLQSLQSRAREADKEVQRLLDKLMTHIGGGFLEDTEKEFVTVTKQLQDDINLLDTYERKAKAAQTAAMNARAVAENETLTSGVGSQVANEAIADMNNKEALAAVWQAQYESKKAEIDPEDVKKTFFAIEATRTATKNRQLTEEYKSGDVGYKQVPEVNEVSAIAQQRVLAAQFGLLGIGAGIDTEANKADALLKKLILDMTELDVTSGEAAVTTASSMDTVVSKAQQELSILKELEAQYIKLKVEAQTYAEVPDTLAATNESILANRTLVSEHRANLDTLVGTGKATAMDLRANPTNLKAQIEAELAAKEQQLVLERQILEIRINAGHVTDEDLKRLNRINAELKNKYKNTTEGNVDISAVAKEYKLTDPTEGGGTGKNARTGKSFIENVVGLATWQVEWLSAMAVLNAVGAAFKNSVVFATEFETEMNKVQVATHASSAQLDGLENVLAGVAGSRTFAPKELGESLVILGQAGYKAADAIKMLPGIADLAIATLSTLKEATEITTSTLEAFSLPVENTASVTNTLAAITTTSRMSLAQLGTAFEGVQASTAGAGISFEDTGTALGLMSNAGIKASTSTTALKTLMDSLMNPSTKFREELNKIGVSVDEINPRYTKLSTTLQTLRSHGFNVQNAFEGIDKRTAGAIYQLAENSGQWDSFESNISGTHRAALGAEAQTHTFDAQGKILHNNVQLLLGGVVEPGLNPAAKLMETLNGVLSSIIKLVSVLPKGALELTGFGLAMGGVATVVATVSDGIKYLYGIEKGVGIFGTAFEVLKKGNPSKLAFDMDKEGNLTDRGKLQKGVGTMASQIINPDALMYGAATATALYAAYGLHKIFTGEAAEDTTKIAYDKSVSQQQELEHVKSLSSSYTSDAAKKSLLAQYGLKDQGELDSSLTIVKARASTQGIKNSFATAYRALNDYTAATTFTEGGRKHNQEVAVDAIETILKRSNVYYGNDAEVHTVLEGFGLPKNIQTRTAIATVMANRELNLEKPEAGKLALSEAKVKMQTATTEYNAFNDELVKGRKSPQHVETTTERLATRIGNFFTPWNYTDKNFDEHKLSPSEIVSGLQDRMQARVMSSSRYLKAESETTSNELTGAQTAVITDLNKALEKYNELTKTSKELQEPGEVEANNEALKDQEKIIKELMRTAGSLVLTHIPGLSTELANVSKGVANMVPHYIDFLAGSDDRDTTELHNSMFSAVSVTQLGPLAKKFEENKRDWKEKIESDLAKGDAAITAAFTLEYEFKNESDLEASVKAAHAKVAEQVKIIQASFKTDAFSNQLQVDLGLQFGHMDQQLGLANKLDERVAKSIRANNETRFYDWNISKYGIRNDITADTGEEKTLTARDNLDASLVEISAEAQAKKDAGLKEMRNILASSNLGKSDVYNAWNLPGKDKVAQEASLTPEQLIPAGGKNTSYAEGIKTILTAAKEAADAQVNIDKEAKTELLMNQKSYVDDSINLYKKMAEVNMNEIQKVILLHTAAHERLNEIRKGEAKRRQSWEDERPGWDTTGTNGTNGVGQSMVEKESNLQVVQNEASEALRQNQFEKAYVLYDKASELAKKLQSDPRLSNNDKTIIGSYRQGFVSNFDYDHNRKVTDPAVADFERTNPNARKDLLGERDGIKEALKVLEEKKDSLTAEERTQAQKLKTRYAKLENVDSAAQDQIMRLSKERSVQAYAMSPELNKTLDNTLYIELANNIVAKLSENNAAILLAIKGGKDKDGNEVKGMVTQVEGKLDVNFNTPLFEKTSAAIASKAVKDEGPGISAKVVDDTLSGNRQIGTLP